MSKVATIKLRDRAARLETRFLSRPPEAQAALVNLIVIAFQCFGPGGKLPTEDITAVMDLLQNVGGKLERGGLGTQAQLLAEVQAGAPTLTGRVFDALAK